MTPGDRVRITKGPGAGHEGVVVGKNGNHYKVRTNDFGSGPSPRVVVKGRGDLEPVRVFNEFQGREFKPWVPPKPVIRDGALDFKSCPSVYSEATK